MRLRQCLILEALVGGPKTAHGIGEHLSRKYAKLSRFDSCTFLSDRDTKRRTKDEMPIGKTVEDRLYLDGGLFCTHERVSKEVSRKFCEKCLLHQPVRMGANPGIYTNLESLMKHGIVSSSREEGGSEIFSLNQGCFDHTIVFKTKSSELVVISCPHIDCAILLESKKRKVGEECAYFKYLYTKEPIIKVRL